MIYLDRLVLAQQRLSAPPRSAHSKRPLYYRGSTIVAFALDLTLASSQNTHRHQQGWQLRQHRANVLKTMAEQELLWYQDGRTRWTKPIVKARRIPGEISFDERPQVNVVRFSTRATDAYANFGKEMVDCLQMSRRVNYRGRQHFVPGLNFIVNDSPNQIEENQWHELIGKGEDGFVYLELRV